MAENKKNPGADMGSQLIGIQSPFSGWVSPLSSVIATPHFNASVEGVEAGLNQAKKNQYAESDGVTLFRPEKLGHLAPGQGFSVVTDASANINDLPLNGDVESSINSYGICVLKNGRIVQINLSTQAYVAKYTPTSHTPNSSSNGDMIIFRDNAATVIEYVVWSWDWNSSGNADISIIKAADIFSNSTDGWYSGLSGVTALKGGVPHKLCKGPDGNIYVTDGSRVQQITIGATAGLGSAAVGLTLQIGAGWIATGICAYKNYVAVIASANAVPSANHGATRVFLWDGTSSTVNGVTSTAPQFIFDIPDNFGNGIYFDGNVLCAFTNGRNYSSKIYEFTGKGFKKAFETPFISPSTNPIQGSMDNFQDSLVLGATKGNASGHLFRLFDGGFHDEGYLCDGDTASGNMATGVGMVKNLYQNFLFVGVSYSTTYKIFITNPNTYQTGTSASSGTIDFRTILYTSGILGRRMYPLGFKMTITRIKLFLSQWGTGAALRLSLFQDYKVFGVGLGNDLLNLLIDTDTATANSISHKAYPTGTTEIDLSDFSLVDISSFYMNIRWVHALTTNTPAIIRRMEIHVEQSQ